MERWIFARHGQTEDNALGRLSDEPEVALSALGHAQAVALAAQVCGLEVAQLWCSPMRRAQQTAAPVAARMGLPIGTLDGLRERRLGALAGRLRAEIRLSPEAGDLTRWHPGPTGGEGLLETALRACDALRALPPAPCRLIISHAGVIRALIGAIDGSPRARRGALRVENAAPMARSLPAGAMSALFSALLAERDAEAGG